MEVIKEVINQSFGKLRIDPEQGRMGQNFEGVKNDLFVERERERLLLPICLQTNQAFNLSVFCSYRTSPAGRQFNIRHGESAPYLRDGFYIFKINDKRSKHSLAI